MGRIASCNNKGMTLIEIMIALVILMIVSLALLQTALLGIKENLRNAIRDEAVSVAEKKMNELRSTPASGIANGPMMEETISRKFRGANVNFKQTGDVSSVGTDARQINVAVSWTYSGQTYTHSVTTIMKSQ